MAPPSEKIGDTKSQPPDDKPKRGCLGRGVAIAGVLASLLYLINPGAGVIELIPDNVPLIGNIDEAFVTAILLACLSYLGINVMPFRRR